ncbi:uncharacterized protein SRS1_25007 [Sporisorium reilianum f. sp. reilianum]|uniref:Uncharacterized protein n=1 Tax=Sporisorium reilianum f. sp. reilianum TaxID=72559 RepID=A0A2N8UHD1_9BASI|nr:uncharacterized protein SRS1_25007 [Sporisorium reilianum f. sp. reilianum]
MTQNKLKRKQYRSSSVRTTLGMNRCQKRQLSMGTSCGGHWQVCGTCDGGCAKTRSWFDVPCMEAPLAIADVRTRSATSVQTIRRDGGTQCPRQNLLNTRTGLQDSKRSADPGLAPSRVPPVGTAGTKRSERG